VSESATKIGDTACFKITLSNIVATATAIAAATSKRADQNNGAAAFDY